MFFFSFFFQHIIFMKDKGRSLFCHWLMTYFGRYLQLSFLKLPRHFLLFKENFNWRIISLQHFVGFSCATTSISHKYTYIPSLQSLPSHVHPALLLLLLLFFCPSRSSQSTRLNDPAVLLLDIHPERTRTQKDSLPRYSLQHCLQ